MATAWELVRDATLPAADGDSVRQGCCLLIASAPILSEHVAFVSNAELDDAPQFLSLQKHAWGLALERLRRRWSISIHLLSG